MLPFSFTLTPKYFLLTDSTIDNYSTGGTLQSLFICKQIEKSRFSKSGKVHVNTQLTICIRSYRTSSITIRSSISELLLYRENTVAQKL